MAGNQAEFDEDSGSYSSPTYSLRSATRWDLSRNSSITNLLRPQTEDWVARQQSRSITERSCSEITEELLSTSIYQPVNVAGELNITSYTTDQTVLEILRNSSSAGLDTTKSIGPRHFENVSTSQKSQDFALFSRFHNIHTNSPSRSYSVNDESLNSSLGIDPVVELLRSKTPMKKRNTENKTLSSGCSVIKKPVTHFDNKSSLNEEIQHNENKACTLLSQEFYKLKNFFSEQKQHLTNEKMETLFDDNYQEVKPSQQCYLKSILSPSHHQFSPARLHKDLLSSCNYLKSRNPKFNIAHNNVSVDAIKNRKPFNEMRKTSDNIIVTPSEIFELDNSTTLGSPSYLSSKNDNDLNIDDLYKEYVTESGCAKTVNVCEKTQITVCTQTNLASTDSKNEIQKEAATQTENKSLHSSDFMKTVNSTFNEEDSSLVTTILRHLSNMQKKNSVQLGSLCNVGNDATEHDRLSKSPTSTMNADLDIQYAKSVLLRLSGPKYGELPDVLSENDITELSDSPYFFSKNGLIESVSEVNTSPDIKNPDYGESTRQLERLKQMIFQLQLIEHPVNQMEQYENKNLQQQISDPYFHINDQIEYPLYRAYIHLENLKKIIKEGELISTITSNREQNDDEL